MQYDPSLKQETSAAVEIQPGPDDHIGAEMNQDNEMVIAIGPNTIILKPSQTLSLLYEMTIELLANPEIKQLIITQLDFLNPKPRH